MEKTRTKAALGFPSLILIAGTRVILGAGIALLLADRLTPEQRKAVGWALFVIGVLSTIPLGMEVFGSRRLPQGELIRNEFAA